MADVRVGSALRYGVVTHNGDREAVSGLVMMLAGSNSRDVITAVKAQNGGDRARAPSGRDGIEVVYDRADFVGRTLTTVGTNLAEGSSS